MKTKRKTQITVRTERFLIVGKRRSSFFAVCAECGARLVTPEAAALLLGRRTRDVYREIESGTLHSVELSGGELLVCCGAP